MNGAIFLFFLASVAGAICDIGGGVIIKLVLDMLRLETVATITKPQCRHA